MPKMWPLIGNHRREFLQLIYDLDELLASRRRVPAGAVAGRCQTVGRTDAEHAPSGVECPPRADALGRGKNPALRDYAWKEWSGMFSGFYARRWELFFQRQREALQANRPFDERACDEELLKLEDRWAGQGEHYPTQTAGQSAAVAGRLFEKYMRSR